MLFWIAIGGAVGSVLRYIVGGAVQRAGGIAFPAGTLAVNVIGAFAVGALSQHYLNMQTSPMMRAALITGFCGGFTTFSAFSIETIGLLEGGAYGKAAAYMVLSVTMSLGATLAGMAAVKTMA